MGSSRRRPASNRGSNRNSNQGPGRVAPAAPGMIDSGYAEVPIGAPTPVMRSWAANGEGRMQATGPWQSPPQAQPGPVDEEQLLADEPPMRAGPDPQTAGEWEQGPAFDPEAMFGSLREDPLDPEASDLVDAGSDFAGPTKKDGSTGSSPLDNPLVVKARAKAFAKLAAAAFAALSGLINERLALHDDDQTWLADDEDLQMVGDPAGRIIARHAPLPGGTDANDLSDAIEIAIGGAGYLIKNSVQRARLRRMLRRAPQPGA